MKKHYFFFGFVFFFCLQSYSTISKDYFYFRFNLKDSVEFVCKDADDFWDESYCHQYKKEFLQFYVGITEYLKNPKVDLYYYHEDIKNKNTKIECSGKLTNYIDTHSRIRVKIKNIVDLENIYRLGRGIIGLEYTFNDDVYQHLFYPLIKNDIYFIKTAEQKYVEHGYFYNFHEVHEVLEETEINKKLSEMLEDIKYTASEMKSEMESPEIVGGLFHGQDIFEAMENSTIEHIREFIYYVSASPEKYRGQNWKISEVYATWIYSKTPQATIIIGK